MTIKNIYLDTTKTMTSTCIVVEAAIGVGSLRNFRVQNAQLQLQYETNETEKLQNWPIKGNYRLEGEVGKGEQSLKTHLVTVGGSACR